MLTALQVVESTGYVMVPYLQYPNLMGALLSMLADRNNYTLRNPVIVVSNGSQVHSCKTPSNSLTKILLALELLAARN